MSTNVLQTRTVNNKTVARNRLWILIWVLVSVVPVAPYGLPLLDHALADTPYAYLIWIPILAFAWGAIELWKTPKYEDDGELNGILGLFAAALSGGVLFAGLHKWSSVLVADNVGLLVWPFWALSMGWLLFGVGATPRLWKPLVYLLLAWPPLYTRIVNATNPTLYWLANHSIMAVTPSVPWLKTTTTYGEYLVQNHGNWLLVDVSSACSGADSFLAMVILLPVILVAFGGNWIRKIWLIVIGGALAVILNLARLGILLISGHLFSATFTFGFLHEILGMVLFAVILVILASIGKRIGMNADSLTQTPSDAGRFLITPGWGRSLLSISTAALLTVGIFPLYTWVSGSFGTPIPVNTDKLSSLMPQMPGYTRSLLGVYNEASVLGPGSYGEAYAYSNPKGQYAMAEMWWTYNLNSLVAYGVHNCLLFHGNSIVGQHPFKVSSGISGDSFAVLLAPSTVGGSTSLYEDVSYIYAVKYNGRNAYIRAEFAAPVQYGVSQNSPLVHQVAASLPTLWANAKAGSVHAADLNLSSAMNAKSLVGFHQFVSKFSSVVLHPSTNVSSS